MSSCDDAFKKLQALQAQKDEIDARVAKLAAQVELEDCWPRSLRGYHQEDGYS